MLTNGYNCLLSFVNGTFAYLRVRRHLKKPRIRNEFRKLLCDFRKFLFRQ